MVLGISKSTCLSIAQSYIDRLPGRDCSTVTRTSFGNSRAQVAKKAAGCFSAV